MNKNAQKTDAAEIHLPLRIPRYNEGPMAATAAINTHHPISNLL
jgi:hypothetical protein